MKKSPKKCLEEPQKTKSGQKIQNSHPVLEKLEKRTPKKYNWHHIKNRKYMKYSKQRNLRIAHLYARSAYSLELETKSCNIFLEKLSQKV